MASDRLRTLDLDESAGADGPVILRVENWRGLGLRGAVVLGWSEMDRGPVDTGMETGAPAGDGLRDAAGTLAGGLYAVDYERGKADFLAGREPPRMTTASYDLGRQRASEDRAALDELKAKLDAEHAASQARLEAMLLEKGRPDLVADLRAKLDDVRSGVWGARSTWAALSAAQRRLLVDMDNHDWHVRRDGMLSVYDAHGADGARAHSGAARRPTVRALASRKLVGWSGPDGDPERRADLSDHGRFVLANGRTGDA